MKINKIATAISAIALVVGFSGQAFAAKNAEVNFSARLVAATCDISASKNTVNLGTHVIADVKNTTDPVQKENFSLTLNKCSKIGEQTGADEDLKTSDIELLALGTALAGHDDKFADANASQVGIQLTATDKNVVLKPNVSTVIPVQITSTTGDYIVPMTAGLFATATGATLTPQDINVPVTFSVAYN